MDRPEFHRSIQSLAAREWNALGAGANPFTRHEFLAALERSHCVGPGSGWEPRYLTLRDAHGLAAAAAAVVKRHSVGEFVFDFAWARAAESHGIAYYPKLTLAVPFTPATGPRLLVRSGLDGGSVRARLLDAVLGTMRERGCSSVHALFIDEAARAACARAGWLLRRDCHFQWHNRGYRSFEHFLASFSAEKRKKVRRERRRVLEQGIEFRTVHGDDITAAQIERVYRFHALTFARHGHVPYLNPEGFARLAARLGRAFMVKLALRGTAPVAAAVFLRGGDTLYGRYWGADADYHSLHFEACYYQGIDYCIEQGLTRFEPGTQGEHKIARGFEAAITWSAHWIEHAGLRAAIAHYLRREAVAIDAYAAEVDAHAPYRSAPP
jgi:predicted N-acyltransferase